MKPPFLKKPLSPALQKAALLLMDDCIAKLGADNMIKAKSTIDGYSKALKAATGKKTRTGAIMMVILFELVPFKEIIEIIPEEMRPHIKIMPKENT